MPGLALAIGQLNHGAGSLDSTGIDRTGSGRVTSATVLGAGPTEPGSQVSDLTARLRRTWLELSVLRVDTISLYDLDPRVVTSTSGLQFIVLPPTYPVAFYLKPAITMESDYARDSWVTLGSFLDTADGSRWTLELTSSVPLIPSDGPWSTVTLGHGFALTETVTICSEWHIEQLLSGVDYGGSMTTSLNVDSLLDW